MSSILLTPRIIMCIYYIYIYTKNNNYCISVTVMLDRLLRISFIHLIVLLLKEDSYDKYLLFQIVCLIDSKI